MTFEQRIRIRAAQKDIFLPERELDQDELIKRQEALERLINDMLLEELNKLMGMKEFIYSRKIGVLVGLSKEDIVELRTMNGDAFLIAGKLDWENFQQQMLRIEAWIDQVIDKQLVNAMAPIIHVGQEGPKGEILN